MGKLPTFKILAIDPSSHFVGISILTIEVESMRIKNIETGLINLRSSSQVSEVHSKLISRMLTLERLIEPIVKENKPLILAYERGFADSKKPGAFEPLVMSVTTVVTVLKKILPSSVIVPFSPGAVKNAMGQKGNCKKDAMKAACLVDVRINEFVDAKAVSEHEIDATAVGLCAIDYFRNRLALLI